MLRIGTSVRASRRSAVPFKRNGFQLRNLSSASRSRGAASQRRTESHRDPRESSRRRIEPDQKQLIERANANVRITKYPTGQLLTGDYPLCPSRSAALGKISPGLLRKNRPARLHDRGTTLKAGRQELAGNSV
jgi:hypothetical protein